MTVRKDIVNIEQDSIPINQSSSLSGSALVGMAIACDMEFIIVRLLAKYLKNQNLFLINIFFYNNIWRDNILFHF